MKTNTRWTLFAGLLSVAYATLASAGQASTSATAGSDGYGSGGASATANYDGNGIGITQTRTHSGRLNLARGVSVGIDEDGLMLSTSYALAPTRGPAVGGTFNLRIGADGDVSGSAGRAVATGDRNREVNALGFVSGSRFAGGSSGASVGGTTGPRGRVTADSRSFDRSRGNTRDRRFDASRDRGGSGRRVILKRNSPRRF